MSEGAGMERLAVKRKRIGGPSLALRGLDYELIPCSWSILFCLAASAAGPT